MRVAAQLDVFAESEHARQAEAVNMQNRTGGNKENRGLFGSMRLFVGPSLLRCSFADSTMAGRASLNQGPAIQLVLR